MKGTEKLMTGKEAATYLAKAPAGSQFRIFVWMKGYRAESGTLSDDGDVFGIISVTRKEAVMFAGNCIRNEAEKRGIKTKIAEYTASVGRNGKRVTIYQIC